MEAAGDGRGQGADGQRLGQPGNSFEEDVAIGQETDEQAFDHGVLPDDHLAQLPGDCAEHPAFLDQPGIGRGG